MRSSRLARWPISRTSLTGSGDPYVCVPPRRQVMPRPGGSGICSAASWEDQL